MSERKIFFPLWRIGLSAVWRALGRPFDARYGVVTEGRRQPGEMQLVAGSPADAYEYAPSPVRAFWLSVGALRIDASRFAFIDYGSGMGRALILAGLLPYRRIEGVEIAGELNAIAGANIERNFPGGIAGGRFALHTTEATQYRIPSCPCVIYLFNPFGRDTLLKLADIIAASYAAQPRPIYVVYVNPTLRTLFEQRGFKPVGQSRLHRFLDRRIPSGSAIFRLHA
ncbi:hypothetical protein Q8W71_21910 [Methylobacterium sp. NEAU 140]|uniref:hypothetical protein n=1 Tax=Methylobacterium sp. NEAU 140 TaxID=3064945 RepID=UPI0027342346|nr:hypothetical protein [Methylobacterium sp. NEAU 140]MDP4025290.1 hypothetical protein [Methylobacterium sp. NEAU 140]